MGYELWPQALEATIRYAHAKTGVPIYVGRGADKNDELTWKIARGNDLWLHTRDVPGAHVVVPLDRGAGGAARAVDAETLVDAATLAAHHSDARDEATFLFRTGGRDAPDEQVERVTRELFTAPTSIVESLTKATKPFREGDRIRLRISVFASPSLRTS